MNEQHHHTKKWQLGIPEIILFSVSLLISVFLMVSTFSYKDGSMLIASHAWSDFASHIPLIRSFTYGNNFPPQYPLFAGPHIKYHFLMYAFAGMLEKIGVRIDYALNIPSILGFFALCIAVYWLSYRLFKNRAVSVLSVIFFLFNGTASFILFFAKHPLSVHTLTDIVHSTAFASFGPYDNGIVSAFWNWNIYTNQRHLAPSYALSLALIVLFLFSPIQNKTYKKFFPALLGIILGISFFFNIAVFSMTVVLIGALSVLFPELFFSGFLLLAIAGIIALPQYRYVQQAGGYSIQLHVGYLINGAVTIKSFFIYWAANLGFHILFIPIGLFLATKKQRKVFLAFFALFVIANLFQFSPEVAADHKFFNLWMFVGVMFSAYAIVSLWNRYSWSKPLLILCTFFLVLSGILDIFPIYNDTKIQLADIPTNPDITWIIHHTDPHAVFLSNNYLYDTASLAGRKLFLGWPYFSWSQGYDTDTRGKLVTEMFSETTPSRACTLFTKNNISYIEIVQSSLKDPNSPPVSPLYLSEFHPVYADLGRGVAFISVHQSCGMQP